MSSSPTSERFRVDGVRGRGGYRHHRRRDHRGWAGVAPRRQPLAWRGPRRGLVGTLIQLALAALLVAAAVKNYVGRETIEPPKWLGKLQAADAKKAFQTGMLVILLMPSDVIILLTVGTNLEHFGSSLSDALPFVAATVLVAALPLLGFLLVHRRAQKAMPKVRDWMNANSWLVNIIVCGIFVLLIL